MNRQNQLPQQRDESTSSHQPTPIAPNPPGGGRQMLPSTNMHPQQQQHVGTMPNGVTQAHLMGLMTNPAIAAAAAASPLFPPAAVFTNPGAFLAIPDLLGQQPTQHSQQASQAAAAVNAANGFQAVQIGASSYAPYQNAGNSTAANFHQNGSQMGVATNAGSQAMQPQMHAPPSQAHASVPGQLGNQPRNITMNGMPISMIPSAVSSAVQAQMAAAAAAARAIAEPPSTGDTGGGKKRKGMSAEERAKMNRDRNREHARSTRLRKKAYVQKLKELVEGLHSERTEEVRQRRVAIQHLAETQTVRRAVVRSFLRFHANNEREERKWVTILEDSFFLKQPVTPYRCFPRHEIEEECRISKGVEAIVADAASIAVMVEGVGSRSRRWMHIRREDFFLSLEGRDHTKRMPNVLVGQDRFQHAVSSLSTGSGGSAILSSGVSSGDENRGSTSSGDAAENSSTREAAKGHHVDSSNGLHDYNAKPMTDSEPWQPTRRFHQSSSSGDDARVGTDSSSGEDSAAAIRNPHPSKRQKTDDTGSISQVRPIETSLPTNIAKAGGIVHSIRAPASATGEKKYGHGGLDRAPAVKLPPFSGLGKKASTIDTSRLSSRTSESDLPNPCDGDAQKEAEGNTPVVVSGGDIETSSSNSSSGRPHIRCYYHVNEDDMVLMDDILMCPFVFRTQDAVVCGALAECIMPGMLRAAFSSRNQLLSVEMTYDAMGFMQQLERASGSETMAQIIPGSLEMALSPALGEARVITLADPPFQIVNVNEAWTQMTKYTLVDVEGKGFLDALDRAISGAPQQKPITPKKNLAGKHDIEEAARGRSICSTQRHYAKDGKEIIDFICSYPLTSVDNDVTHLLHVCRDLPPLETVEDSSE